jgi:hypothetical protein
MRSHCRQVAGYSAPACKGKGEGKCKCKVKVKVTLEQATKHQGGSRSIALLFL